MVVNISRQLFVVIFVSLFSQLFASGGKIVAIKGDATIIRDKENLIAKYGNLLKENDELLTKDKAKVQLLFEDNTVITVGENSHFKINDFLFDESNKEYNANFGLLKGGFRTITGQIGKIAPEKFKLTSKTSSIGIRGTHILSRIEIRQDKVICVEGEIIVVDLKSQEEIIIKAGEYVIVPGMILHKLTQNDVETLDIDTRFLSNEEKEVQLDKFSMDEIVGWGNWKNTTDINDLYSLQNQQSSAHQTNPDSIINFTHIASYTGKVEGAHLSGGVNVGNYIDNANNFISMDINFGTNTITNGQMNAEYFNVNAGALAADTIAAAAPFTGNINADGSGFNIIGPMGAVPNPLAGGWAGTGTGEFLGNNAELIQGNLQFEDGNTESIQVTSFGAQAQ